MKIWQSIKNRLIKKQGPAETRFFPRPLAGVHVDHDTALNFSAVFACVRYVAETVAGLPWRVYLAQADGGKKIATTHNLDKILHLRPNPEMSAFAFKTTMLAHAQTWGNAYAEIEKDAAGRVVGLWPIEPGRVAIRRDEKGALYYEISNPRSAKVNLPADKIFHLAGMGFDGIRGYSIISLAATSIGAGIAADQFVASFYGNGAVLSGALTYPKTLSDDGFKRLKKDFADQYGGARKAWKPLILEDGGKWETFGMPLKDAEFLASQKYRVTDIARWFRVPPHKVADLDRATFTNIEHQSIEVVQDSILPWALRSEQEADYKLISPRTYGVFYTKMNLMAMMRGDHETRGKYYKAMKESGNMNTNEIRLLEDMNPIGPKGDKYTMQGQYTTLEKIGEEPAKARRHTDFETDEDDEAADEIKNIYGKILLDTTGRILRRENSRVDHQLKKKLPAEKFLAWLDVFMAEHKKYICNALTPAVESILTHRKADERLAGEILDDFSQRHVAAAEILISDYKGAGFNYPAAEDSQATVVDSLIRQILLTLK